MHSKKLLSEKEAQAIYGYSLAWWRRARWAGNGAPFLKLNNGRIAYRLEDLERYFSGFRVHRSTSEYKTGAEK